MEQPRLNFFRHRLRFAVYFSSTAAEAAVTVTTTTTMSKKGARGAERKHMKNEESSYRLFLRALVEQTHRMFASKVIRNVNLQTASIR